MKECMNFIETYGAAIGAGIMCAYFLPKLGAWIDAKTTLALALARSTLLEHGEDNRKVK